MTARYSTSIWRGWYIEQDPGNRRKLDVVLNYIAEKFEFDRVYTEKEINAVIGALNSDISGLRRDLISSKLLGREKDGSAYWRIRQ